MNKKKTITIIGPSSRFLSGISYYTLYLSNALSEKYEVTSVLFRKMLPTFLFPGSARVGADLSSLSYNPSVHVNECIDWFNPISWYRAYSLAKKSEVCIFEWWTSSVAHMYLFIGFFLKSKHIPIILEFHEVVDTLEESILPIRLYSKIMGKLIRKLSAAYVVHSEHDRTLVSDRYYIPLEKISVIPHGLYDQYPVIEKNAAKKHLGITASKIILFFGLLRPYKGVTQLIHAFEELPKAIKNDAVLIIAGEPWEDMESVSVAEHSQDSDKIHLFSTYISDEEVPYFFSAADLIVLPYTRASQSGVAHIGISYGMPIIASRVGGLVESLSKYDGTVFVSPENISELSAAIKNVLEHDQISHPIPESLRWDGVSGEWEELVDVI